MDKIFEGLKRRGITNKRGVNRITVRQGGVLCDIFHLWLFCKSKARLLKLPKYADKRHLTFPELL
jgi:hypothetical protein